MNYVKSKQRNSMSPSTLEAHIRIREYGPKSVDALNSHEIAEQWLKTHIVSGTGKIKLSLLSYRFYSFLFV